MYLLKKIILLTIIFFFSQGNLSSAEPVSFILKEINIQGKTNISPFHLTYKECKKGEHLIAEGSSNSEKILFKIPVKNFKSKNPIMTEDFIHLLKADIYPDIEVEINKFQLIEIANGNNHKKEFPLYLSLTGESRKAYSIYNTAQYSDCKILLEGFTQIQLKDFNLEPPEKMLGVVQVKERILIKFDVIISSI